MPMHHLTAVRMALLGRAELFAGLPGALEPAATLDHWIQSPEAWRGILGEDTHQAWSRQLEQELRKLSITADHLSSGIPQPPPVQPAFRFIDLFAGIGGFRIALQRLGGQCVFSSEWNGEAQVTYAANFGERPFGDITRFTAVLGPDPDHPDLKQLAAMIPDHDVLAGGFPCQPFSRAGVSARNSLGQGHGFACRTQGTLFFDIAQIAAAKRPKVLLLENVRNLELHDGGRTFAIIRQAIEEELGYSLEYRVLNAQSLVPQRRERVFMVAFRDDIDAAGFKIPALEGPPLPLRLVLEDEASDSYGISQRLWDGHVNRSARNKARGAGFAASIADLDRPANTLVARYGKDGKECLVGRGPSRTPRMLTERECARLQGFPEDFLIPVAKTHAYRQFGNAVVVPVVEHVAQAALQRLAAPEDPRPDIEPAAVELPIVSQHVVASVLEGSSNVHQVHASRRGDTCEETGGLQCRPQVAGTPSASVV